MAIELRRIYYMKGSGAKGSAKYFIGDPPAAGWQYALIETREKGKYTILCPYTLRHWNIPKTAGELEGVSVLALEKQQWADKLLFNWDSEYVDKAKVDFTVVAHFLELLGAGPISVTKKGLIRQRRASC